MNGKPSSHPMANPHVAALTPRRRKRLLILGLLRATATTAALVFVYYILPLDNLSGDDVLRLVLALAVFSVVAVLQTFSVVKSKYPVIRAVEALAASAPLFILIFAAAYWLMSYNNAANFSQPDLTRTDALYFTVTVFATVGFGDIAASSQTARAIVTVQMVLDLLILGLGIRVFLSAVKLGRERIAESDTAASEDV